MQLLYFEALAKPIPSISANNPRPDWDVSSLPYSHGILKLLDFEVEIRANTQ